LIPNKLRKSQNPWTDRAWAADYQPHSDPDTPNKLENLQKFCRWSGLDCLIISLAPVYQMTHKQIVLLATFIPARQTHFTLV
jgi:hypothetical protein